MMSRIRPAACRAARIISWLGVEGALGFVPQAQHRIHFAFCERHRCGPDVPRTLRYVCDVSECSVA